MKENADNKNITSAERRILKFFFALTDREKNVRELADALGVSLSTAQRYSKNFEAARIARIRKENGKACRGGKIVELCQSTYFVIVRVKENTVDILLVSFLPKYEYSVILPYNESLSDADNAMYIKRILDKLCAQARAEKTFVGIVLSEGSCISENTLRETVSNASKFDNFKSKILSYNNRKARYISTEDIISALVIETVRNVRNKTVD